MNTLWIFNPDNDIALGNNLRRFTPPRNAMLLRNCGAMLPLWIADNGDIIYADDSNQQWLKNMSEIFNKDVILLSSGNMGRIEKLRPWGWSNAIAGDLIRLGISPQLIPDRMYIDRIRLLSHRRSSVIINRQLEEAGFNVPMPVEISDIETVEKHLQQIGPAVIKSPWSSSGRGVVYTEKMQQTRLLSLAAGMIKNQGSVLVEPLLDKIMDFAMLFDICDGIARYVGLSVFDTLATGNYTGNIVASEQHLTAVIGRYTDITILRKLQKYLEIILSELVGNTYTGICGVDMMIHNGNDGTPLIAPCIELNLRNTMGYIAHCLARDIIAPEITGRMTVTYTGATQTTTNPGAISPDFDSGNRLIAGVLPLIPPNPYFAISLTANTKKFCAVV